MRAVERLLSDANLEPVSPDEPPPDRPGRPGRPCLGVPRAVRRPRGSAMAGRPREPDESAAVDDCQRGRPRVERRSRRQLKDHGPGRPDRPRHRRHRRPRDSTASTAPRWLGSTDDRLDFKAIASPNDRIADIDPADYDGERHETDAERRRIRRAHAGGQGLVLIYPISAHSKATPPPPDREPRRMDMPGDGHVIGFADLLPSGQ